MQWCHCIGNNIYVTMIIKTNNSYFVWNIFINGLHGMHIFIFLDSIHNSVTLNNTGALISIHSCLTNAQIILN